MINEVLMFRWIFSIFIFNWLVLIHTIITSRCCVRRVKEVRRKLIDDVITKSSIRSELCRIEQLGEHKAEAAAEP